MRLAPSLSPGPDGFEKNQYRKFNIKSVGAYAPATITP